MADDPRAPTPLTDAPGAPPAARLSASPPREDDIIVVYQHSMLFYWWPVWFFGFLFALITYIDGYHMAIVPGGTTAASARLVEVEPGKEEARDVLILGKDRKLLTTKENDKDVVRQPDIFVTRYRSLGTMFLFVLLLVIFITNITLRGQWSLVVMIILIALAVIFWLAGYWEWIFERLGHLSIYMNMGAYMMISLVIFILWVVNVFFFDRQMYAVFTPGNVRICQEIGMGETLYDTFQMTVQKHRSDLFRHVFLGFGSGDIVMRFPRHPHPVELHNILNINKVLRRVSDLTHERRVVQESPDSPENS